MTTFLRFHFSRVLSRHLRFGAVHLLILAQAATAIATASDILKACSFNIQFLGSSTRRDDAALAELVQGFDLVIVQELIAAPATSPTDQPGSRQRAAAFFRQMASRGFEHTLSESDTGRKGPLPNYGSATEWFVVFFRPNRLRPAPDLPHGFIGQPLAANPAFDRVPYAFAYRTVDAHFDFVVINVHLNPDDARRRLQEVTAIGGWIEAQRRIHGERDYLVVGDMNFQHRVELHAAVPRFLVSLNDACKPTNVNPRVPRPYDHVLFDEQHTSELDRSFGFQVINLIDAMRTKWRGRDPYPGSPYQPDLFRYYYSDHHPVAFQFVIPAADDDP